jgi:putative membrane protein
MSSRCLDTLVLTLLPGVAPTAWAHAPEAREPVLAWGTEPWVLALLALSMALYAAGLLRLWPRSRGGRHALLSQGGAFLAGWLTLVAALASPLDALGSQLFSAHMLQHELLMIVAAPLLVMGRPSGIWLWALPGRTAIGVAVRHPLLRLPWQWLTLPLVSWLLHAVALWAWHAPRLFEAALASNSVHGWQHTSFLASALLFWWAVLGDGRDRPQRGGAMLYLFTTMLHTGALGALLTWSATLWYPGYAATAGQYGFDALVDQQLGGLIMWIPGALAYLIAGLALAAQWLTGGATIRNTSPDP